MPRRLSCCCRESLATAFLHHRADQTRLVSRAAVDIDLDQEMTRLLVRVAGGLVTNKTANDPQFADAGRTRAQFWLHPRGTDRFIKRRSSLCVSSPVSCSHCVRSSASCRRRGPAEATPAGHRQHHRPALSRAERQPLHGVPGDARRHHHERSDQPRLLAVAQGGDRVAVQGARSLRLVHAQRLGSCLWRGRVGRYGGVHRP